MSSRLTLLVLVFALVAFACGTESVPNVAPEGSEVAEVAVEPTSPTAAGSPTTVTDAEPAAPEVTAGTVAPSNVDGPPAPDFSLALADGSTYQLSADPKPVYLVFWAEW